MDVEDARKAIRGEIDEESIIRKRGIYQSCITVIKDEGLIYDEAELNLLEHEDIDLMKEHEWIDRVSNAMNLQNNSIILRIRLDKGRESIDREFQYLLDLLEKERVHLTSISKKQTLKPRWDIYKKYLEVYDLKEYQDKSWRKIAKKIFSEEKSADSGMRKVRYYYDQAEKMIDGGWKQI